MNHDNLDTNNKNIVERDRFAKWIGIRLLHAQDGYAKACMDIVPDHLNGVGIVQGGVIFTLADFAFAAASNSEGFMTLALSVTISFIKSPKGKSMTASAKKISAGRKICTYSIDVMDEDGELVAHLLATGYMKEKK